MDSNAVFLLSREKPLTEKLSEVLVDKGAKVSTISSSKDLPDNASYVVINNIAKDYSKDRGLVKFLQKSSSKVVALNGANDFVGIDVEGVSLKQIFVDNIYPFYVDSLYEVFRASKGDPVHIPKEAWVAVVTTDLLIEKIIEELFSFSESKKYLYGKLLSYREIISTLSPASEISIDLNANSRVPRKDIAIAEALLDSAFLFSVSIDEQKLANAPRKTVSKRKYTLPKLKVPDISQSTSRKLKYFAAFSVMKAVVLLLSPYLFLVLALGASAASYKYFEGGNIAMARRSLNASSIFSGASFKMSGALSGIPVFGSSVESSGRNAMLLSRGTSAAGRVLSMSTYANGLSEDIFASGEDIDEIAGNLHLELESLYRDLSFIESEIDKQSLPFSNIIPFESLSEYREYVLVASKLSRELPTLLGYDEPKTYLLLLQNNMELRPTGGFIGSFALLTMSKGELIDNTIYDVYSADGQLKGYIEPPSPIINYLGEASWTLRDSNWDPNFPDSARRAEWFLDKSIDRQVDGVIAINLETAQKYLEVLGPLKLHDFDDTVDSKNMYEKVQYEVEGSFFPGSRKKAQYLSSLASALLGRIESSSRDEAISLVTATIDSLNSRDVQVYLHDKSSQSVFESKNWSGEVKNKKCTVENCESVLAGIVEANVGVNKANYFVDRSVQAVISPRREYLDVSVSLEIKNNAKEGDRVPQERYKDYVRVMAGESAHSPKVYVDTDEGRMYPDIDIEKLDGRLEYGALLDVLPGEQKTITFAWRVPNSLDFTKKGSFSLNWWKQSGVEEYPFSTVLRFPTLSNTKSNPPLGLTSEGGFLYNTNLVQDLGLNISWSDK